jgi:hypothetical protein
VRDRDGSCGFSGGGVSQLFIDASELDWVGLGWVETLSIALRRILWQILWSEGALSS